jgi:hypothetical protein
MTQAGFCPERDSSLLNVQEPGLVSFAESDWRVAELKLL